ncbi:Abi family protein [Streptococcus orisasini]|uniref:Abi family protein n=1 Tax=Streptococcus orisasini TaxID=1080071 RepID=UPI0007099880|nr:Abi family protein [Streptococcus orisasini]
MKEHKTFNQQLAILRKRGMTVPKDGRPKRFLEQENYYNVINGYKDLFLKKDANNRPIVPEKYLDGTHFNELRDLFLFDRELRSLFLKYLLIFENSLKTTVAHTFTQEYPKKNAYLDIDNFVDDAPKKVLQQISILTKTIHDKVDKTGAVKHYIEEYGEVPLWVLVNFLTIGNIAHFYNILTDSMKNRIAKFYGNKYNKQYSGNNLRISSHDFESILKAVNLARNICAHDERLYNVNLRNIRLVNIASYYNIKNYDNKRLVVIILFLKVVLDKSYFKTFFSDFIKLCKRYEKQFQTVTFSKILSVMGMDLKELQNNL